jgi:hypothetical protein
MGGSDAPPAGYDKKTMAADVAALIRELGYDQVNLAGRDIGSMVAFSLAANRPELVRKLAMQAELLPEQLLAGRARSLIDFMCARNLRDPDAIADFDREVYARAYSRPEAVRAAGGWYRSFGQDIADLATYPRVTTPIAALHFPGHTDLLTSLADTASAFQGIEIPGTGHYLAEEQPDQVAQALAAFFAGRTACQPQAGTADRFAYRHARLCTSGPPRRADRAYLHDDEDDEHGGQEKEGHSRPPVMRGQVLGEDPDVQAADDDARRWPGNQPGGLRQVVAVTSEAVTNRNPGVWRKHEPPADRHGDHRDYQQSAGCEPCRGHDHAAPGASGRNARTLMR